MRDPFELVHHNRYRLSCRPDPTPEGAFLARVLVSWIGDDGAALDHRLRPVLPPFATAGEAAAVARDVAIQWLDSLEAGRSGGSGAGPDGAPLGDAAPAAAPLPAHGDCDEYLAVHREWRAAAAAFERTVQRALDGSEPQDTARTQLDAAVLARLHERWLEKAMHLALAQRH